VPCPLDWWISTRFGSAWCSSVYGACLGLDMLREPYPRRRRRRREACYLCKRGTHLGDREATGAVLLSLLAVPRIYPKSPLLLLAVAARVGAYPAYPKSRLSLLELGLTAPQACVASRRRVCYP